MKSKKEDWADLVARLTLVAVSVVVTAFLAAAIAGSFLVASTAIVACLVIGIAAIGISVALTFVLNALKVREHLADFVGVGVWNALTSLWNQVIS